MKNDSIHVSPQELQYFYNEALRINADQVNQIEKLKLQINDQAQKLEEYRRRFGDI